MGVRLGQQTRLAGVTVAVALVLVGCGQPGQQAGPTAPPPTAPTATAPTTAPAASAPTAAGASVTSPATGTATPTGPTPASSPSAAPTSGATAPPRWLGTRPLPTTSAGFGEVRRTPRSLRSRAFTLPDTVAALPGRGFASRTEVAPADVIARSTWRPGCPVPAGDLDWVRLTFRGFDQSRHTGELLVNRSVADDVVSVFRRLWQARFPIEQMQITTRAQLDAEPTGDGNDTESFVCRPTVGATTFSQHASGLAIDLDPFQNPYVKGDLVIPELSSAYLDRDDLRPGMIVADGPVVAAFAAIGWTWGGSWTSLKDLQHFSQNGR